jgi:hypothetical protein
LIAEVNASDNLQPLEFGTQRLHQFTQCNGTKLVLGYEGACLPASIAKALLNPAGKPSGSAVDRLADPSMHSSKRTFEATPRG